MARQTIDPSVIGPPPLAFGGDDAGRAREAWGFNCGPAALAALLGLTPEGVRPHLGYFEVKRHMNTNDVIAALRSMGREFRVIEPAVGAFGPASGLVKVQWHGSWMNPGVHPGARAKRTHWIAIRRWGGVSWIYDVNAGGWQSGAEWGDETATRIMAEVKGCDGTFSAAAKILVGEVARC